MIRVIKEKRVLSLQRDFLDYFFLTLPPEDDRDDPEERPDEREIDLEIDGREIDREV